MVRHINRKNICKPKINNIEYEICKEFILNGFSYKEYCNQIKKKQQNKKSTFSQHKNNIESTFSQHLVNIESTFSQHKNNTKSTKGEYICVYCKSVLSYKQSYYRHLKSCKEKQKDDTVRESMEELVSLLNEKDKQLKEKDKEHKIEVEELIKKAGISTINNNNITNNIQNNIKLLNYKETDISHLTESDYIKCLEHYNFCVPHIIKKIHFNPKKPENHNIYISNLKNNYIMIYMNNKWKVKNRDDTISNVIDDKQVLLEKKIQEWIRNGNKYPKLMKKFNRYIEKREQDDVINAIKEEIKLLLYNSRNMIIENKKLLK
jgi:hypothetical protein